MTLREWAVILFLWLAGMALDGYQSEREMARLEQAITKAA